MYKQKRKKTSSQVICQLFHLPRPETIYQDYSCSYLGTISYFGRIYIGEEHFCFNSNMFGIAKHFSIAIDNITKLELERGRIVGIWKNQHGNDENFSFGNFVNVEFAFKLMHGLWKGQRIEAKILGSNEEEKEGELEEGCTVEVDFFNKEVSFSDKQTLAKIYFPCSVQQYFDFFLSDKASLLSCAQYLQLKQAESIKVTEWTRNQQLGREIRELNAVIKVVGVPMRSQAGMRQIHSMLKSEKEIDLSIVTQMSDIPYAAYFTVQQNQKIQYVDEKKCSFEVEAWLRFNKSTMMRRMITDRSSKDIKEDYEMWIKTIQERLKSRIKRSASSPAAMGDTTLEYQNAESTVMNFSRILEEDVQQKVVKKENPNGPRMRRVQIKLNIILVLLAILLGLNIHSHFE